MDKTPEEPNWLKRAIAAVRRLGVSYDGTKHLDQKKGQLTGTFIRKADAKKKRKRKLAYKSKRIGEQGSKQIKPGLGPRIPQSMFTLKRQIRFSRMVLP